MIKKLKSVDSNLKIVVRGIMSVKDAVKAAEYGASAVWIHNDGSFFSASPSPISVLPYISKALEYKKSSTYIKTLYQSYNLQYKDTIC